MTHQPITPAELATLKSFWFAEDARLGGISDTSRCIAEIERLHKIEETARGILPYLSASNDPPESVNAVYVLPSEGLRRAAEQMDQRDAAVHAFRSSLSPAHP
jgi:hypothetical protein